MKTKFFKLLVIFLIAFVGAEAQNSYVTLEDGQQIVGKKVRYRSPAFSSESFIEVDGEQKFPINLVDHYVTEGIYYKKALTEYSQTPTFFKREEEGKRISIYSKLVTTYQPAMGPSGFGSGGTFANTQKSHLYSKGDGPIKTMKIGKLGPDIMDNQKAMVHLKKAKGLAGIQGVLYAVGAGLVIAGAADTLAKTDNKNPGSDNGGPGGLWIAGAATMMITSFAFNGAKRKHMREAIHVYND